MENRTDLDYNVKIVLIVRHNFIISEKKFVLKKFRMENEAETLKLHMHKLPHI